MKAMETHETTETDPHQEAEPREPTTEQTESVPDEAEAYALDWTRAEEVAPIVEAGKRAPQPGETKEQQRRRDEAATIGDPTPKRTQQKPVLVGEETMQEGVHQSLEAVTGVIATATGSEATEKDVRTLRQRCSPLIEKYAGGQRRLSPEVGALFGMAEVVGRKIDWKELGNALGQKLKRFIQ